MPNQSLTSVTTVDYRRHVGLQVAEGQCDVSPALAEVTRLLELGVGGDVELVLLADAISQSAALSLRDGQLFNAGKSIYVAAELK